MADMGFTVHDELARVGVLLNITLFLGGRDYLPKAEVKASQTGGPPAPLVVTPLYGCRLRLKKGHLFWINPNMVVTLSSGINPSGETASQ